MTASLLPSPEHKFAARLRGYFLTGLLVLVPISLTVYIIFELFKAIDGILKDEIFVILRQTFGVTFTFPGVGMIALLLLILGTGMAARSYFGNKLVEFGNRAVTRIPIIRRIYGTVQQLSQALFGEQHQSFKKTVLVPYPNPNTWRLGFYIREIRGEIQEALQREIVCVFIPNPPNPTGGFLMFYPKSEVIELEMPVEDAIHMLISYGTVAPKARTSKHMMLTREHVESLTPKPE